MSVISLPLQPLLSPPSPLFLSLSDIPHPFSPLLPLFLPSIIHVLLHPTAREREMVVDDFIVCVDRLISTACFDPHARVSASASTASGGGGLGESRVVLEGGGGASEGGGCSSMAPMRKSRSRSEMIECRICQEEGEEADMEAPCACNGTLKFAHRKCIQKWCNKKGDITCEICNEIYSPNYIAPPKRNNADSLAIDIRQSWAQQMDLHDPRLLAIEQELLRSDYEDYAAAHNNGIACCRSVALILMILLLIRHALMFTRGTGLPEDASAFVNISLLQLAGIALPCYMIARACSIIQSRRQHQAFLRQVWG